ncbi:MAG: hypothetical protein JOZ44_00355, partial [Acidobacteria bacterium]|nr:hypothetical protein [Acidobacteriota bacterium]
ENFWRLTEYPEKNPELKRSLPQLAKTVYDKKLNFCELLGQFAPATLDCISPECNPFFPVAASKAAVSEFISARTPEYFTELCANAHNRGPPRTTIPGFASRK